MKTGISEVFAKQRGISLVQQAILWKNIPEILKADVSRSVTEIKLVCERRKSLFIKTR